jgi:two-component system, sensor histidine kinase PdtaS
MIFFFESFLFTTKIYKRYEQNHATTRSDIVHCAFISNRTNTHHRWHGSRRRRETQKSQIGMIKKTSFVFLFSIVLCTIALSQSPRAIRENLDKAQSLSYINLDSSLFFVHLALTTARQLDSNGLIFNALRIEGTIYEENNRLKDAQRVYAEALELAEKKLPKLDQLDIYTDWAIIHKKLGQYPIAEIYHRRTIAEAEKLGNWEMVEMGYHGLGTMYSMMGDFDKCITVYLKSIEAAEKWNNTEGVVLTYQNLSNIYYKVKNYEMARKTIAKTYKMALDLGDSLRLSSVLRVYASIESTTGNYKEALEKLSLSRLILEKLGDKGRLAETYSAIAFIYQEQKEYNKAAYFLNKCDALAQYLTSYALADFLFKKGNLFTTRQSFDSAIVCYSQSLAITDSLGFKEVARDNHLALVKVFEQKKDIPRAFSHLSLAYRLSDTLFEEGRQKLMTETKLKFDSDKHEFELSNQAEKLKQSQTVWQVLLIALAGVLGLLFFTWRQMKAKQKAQKRAELLMQELHHRVKNNLQTVSSIMRLQARGITDPSVALVIAESRSRLETISMIHQQLYREDQVKTVNFKHFVGDLVEKLQFAYNFNDKPLALELDMPNPEIDVDTALPLGLIINELLTNSFKYAYPSVSEPKLIVKLSKCRFHFADNGNGSAASVECVNNQSFGLQLIHSLSQQLQGKCRFFNDNGLVFELNFEK